MKAKRRANFTSKTAPKGEFKLDPDCTEQEIPARNRFGILDTLRGLAALAVCFFHFAGRDDLLPEGPLKAASRFGSLGVIAFFVISGFVIPWSLHQAGYHIRDFGRFVLKRLLRLEPPYLAAVGSVVAFIAIYQWVKARPFPPEETWWLQVSLHVGYLTRFFGFDWLDDIYWTLAIEFQFYLLIGLAFPLLGHRVAVVRWVACAALTLLGFSALVLPIKMFVVTYLPIFVLGIVTYQRRIGLLGRAGHLVAVTLAGAACVATAGWLHTLVAVPTTLMIAAINEGWGPLNRLGQISYSLYLFHATLGGAIINLGIKYTSAPAERYLVFLTALFTAFITATLMYHLVEKPAHRWSSAIRYGERRSTPKTAEALDIRPEGSTC